MHAVAVPHPDKAYGGALYFYGNDSSTTNIHVEESIFANNYASTINASTNYASSLETVCHELAQETSLR